MTTRRVPIARIVPRCSAARRDDQTGAPLTPGPDDLRAVADRGAATLLTVVDADWSAPAPPTDWTCRETLEHLCSLAFVWQLATRASGFEPLALQVAPGAPIPQLVHTMHTMFVVLAEVARAAPATARAFHPAGMADPSGWIAMGMDELLIHTSDIATGLGLDAEIDAGAARLVLDRLFPWWPRDADPGRALLWANGRGELGDRPNPGSSWLWHCAPLAAWDGTVPVWDPVARRPMSP